MTVWISRRDDADVECRGPTSESPRAAALLARDAPRGEGQRRRGRRAADHRGVRPSSSSPPDARRRVGGGTARGGRRRRRQDQSRPVRHGLVGTRSPLRRRARQSPPRATSAAARVRARRWRWRPGEADIAIGTDTAGSGRIPAGLQGIVGIKPTRRGGQHRRRGASMRVLRLRNDLRPGPGAREPSDGRDGGAGARQRPWPADATTCGAARVPSWRCPPSCPSSTACGGRRSTPRSTALTDAGARIVTVDLAPFLAAAKLLYDGALVSERYAAVGEFIDGHPDAGDRSDGGPASSPGRATSPRTGWSATGARCSDFARRPWRRSTASTR